MCAATVPVSRPEAPLNPDLEIIDAHHHLWLLPDAALSAFKASSVLSTRALAPVYEKYSRYLIDEFAADVASHHRVVGTVYVQARAMFRASGPQHMRPVGEVEFANGVAAMAESGLWGPTRICAGIVGEADLSLGAAVEEVLEAHMSVAPTRFRGIRGHIIRDDDPSLLAANAPHGLMADPCFREGFAVLGRLGLSYDAWVLEPQLGDVVDIARAFPETQIILNHVGGPVGIGAYQGKRLERFALWRERMVQLADAGNVCVKLGGLGVPFGGFETFMADPAPTSAQLAVEWSPYIEACIELFGARRCMFESNYPVDAAVGSYATIWNAFKRIAAGASPDEKKALFADTARRVYRLA